MWWIFVCYYLSLKNVTDTRCRNDIVAILGGCAISMISYTLLLLFLIITAKNERFEYLKILGIVYLISGISIMYIYITN